MAPPPAQAYGGATVPEAKETWKPVYEGVLERTIRTRSPATALEASAKAPSAAAFGARVRVRVRVRVRMRVRVRVARLDEAGRTERGHVKHGAIELAKLADGVHRPGAA